MWAARSIDTAPRKECNQLPGLTSGLCVMSEMSELIVILLSPITAFTAMMFVGELRGARSGKRL